MTKIFLDIVKKCYLLNRVTILTFIDFLFSILGSLCLKKQKLIVLESKPDISDNTGEIFRYMLNNNIKCRYIWLVDDLNCVKRIKIKNVEFYSIHPKTIMEKVQFRWILNRASVILCSHRFSFPYYKRKKQVFLYLDHGSPLKDCRNIYENSQTSNVYYVTQSHFFDDIIEEQYSIKKENILTLGLPRNDQLFRKYTSLSQIIENISSYKKTIIWAPTFRYHVSKTRVDCHSYMPLGIPIIYSKEEIIKLNSYLTRKGVLLLLKPHPAQNLELIINLNLSNLKILQNEELIKNNIQTNELLSQTDALITDYSSIYYDYLLLRKPIAVTLDDYEQYKSEMGFVFTNPLDILKGVYVHNINDLYMFIDSVLSGRDESRKERETVIDLIEKYKDSHSTERLFNWLKSQGII